MYSIHVCGEEIYSHFTLTLAYLSRMTLRDEFLRDDFGIRACEKCMRVKIDTKFLNYLSLHRTHERLRLPDLSKHRRKINFVWCHSFMLRTLFNWECSRMYRVRVFIAAHFPPPNEFFVIVKTLLLEGNMKKVWFTMNERCSALATLEVEKLVVKVIKLWLSINLKSLDLLWISKK